MEFGIHGGGKHWANNHGGDTTTEIRIPFSWNVFTIASKLLSSEALFWSCLMGEDKRTWKLRRFHRLLHGWVHALRPRIASSLSSESLDCFPMMQEVWPISPIPVYLRLDDSQLDVPGSSHIISSSKEAYPVDLPKMSIAEEQVAMVNANPSVSALETIAIINASSHDVSTIMEENNQDEYGRSPCQYHTAPVQLTGFYPKIWGILCSRRKLVAKRTPLWKQ